MIKKMEKRTFGRDDPRFYSYKIISHNRKFIYFEYPKCASSAIKRAILPFIIHGKGYVEGKNTKPLYTVGDNSWRKIMPSAHFVDDPSLPTYRGYFKFSFVKNPYDKIVSCYTNDKPWIDRKKESFRDFVFSLKPGQKRHPRDLLSRPLNHMIPWTTMFDAKDLDFIGRFENIENDIRYVFGKIGMPRKSLDIVNKSSRKKDYRPYYDAETKEAVTELFKKDLEYFNYSF